MANHAWRPSCVRAAEPPLQLRHGPHSGLRGQQRFPPPRRKGPSPEGAPRRPRRPRMAGVPAPDPQRRIQARSQTSRWTAAVFDPRGRCRDGRFTDGTVMGAVDARRDSGKADEAREGPCYRWFFSCVHNALPNSSASWRGKARLDSGLPQGIEYVRSPGLISQACRPVRRGGTLSLPRRPVGPIQAERTSPHGWR